MMMMAQTRTASSFPNFSTGTWRCFVFFWILFIALVEMAQANKQAFIQTDTVLELLHFGDEGVSQTEPDVNSYHHTSSPLQGNCRPICFQPTMLDFREQPLGMPKMETIYLHNPNAEEISLISISAATSHFHASFFENRIIQPGANISFDVVFLARVVGNVENTLFINTSHHGVSTYQVFGVGVPNPYRLRPFIGAPVPINSSFSPLINIHNAHSEPLQVVEMYSSGRDLHLELPPGQHGGVIYRLWEAPPFETKGVMRATFTSPDADNYTAFIRIKTNASDPDKFMILPVEVEVASARGIYSSIHMLDFGTLRSQDKPKRLNLHLLNSGAKDVQITSIRTSPANDAVMIDFKPITLKAGEKKYAKIASISFDATKVKKISQSSGKITVKTKEKSYNKLEIPYQAEVLEGYLGFDHTVTLFHIRDSVTDPAVRPIHLTNTFRFAISIHDVTLPDKAMSTFKVLNFSQPVLVPPQASWYVFSLEFRPLGSSVHIDDNILLVTNASKFHLPIRAYTGFLQPLVLPPSLKERLVDFGVLSTTNTSNILFAVINTNPIELVLRPWQVTGEHILVDLVETAPGNRTRILTRTRELHSTTTTSTLKTVIVASGYYAVFRVTLSAKDLEGHYDAAIHIPTDYQILTIPVKAFIAVGRLTSHPKHIVLPLSFPGKIVHQSFSIFSSFSQRLKLLHIRSLTDDKRFYYRRAKSSQDELEPNRRSKVAKIYFDASQQCGRYCYSALPFILKAEARPCSGLVMQEDAWDTDGDLYQMLSERWRQLKEKAEAVFEADADLQKGVQTTVSAQLEWPSILRCPRHVFFPLTGVNSSSEVEVPLENPANSVLYIQILPMALYPNIPKMLQMIPWERYPHFNQSSLEFQVIRNQTTALKSEEGFIEGSTQPFVYNLPLQPEERKTLKLQFSPTTNHTVTSLLLLRNNLTALEFLVVQGQGCYESIRVGGKSPGPGAFLRFKMVESHLKECTEENQPKEPNFTLRRSFKMENTGQLPIHIQSIEINGRSCEGFGFKVNCQEFVLKPNASSDMVILFTPDFTASRVIRELMLTSARGSQFLFSLNASLPFHMLAACSSALPRPDWEAELYVLISVTMSSMLVLVMATAYLEALGIWEVFKKRMGYEAPGDPMETGKPFDLRDIVQLQGSTSPAMDSSAPLGHLDRQKAGSRSTRGGHSRSAAQLPLAPYPLVATAPDSSASPSQHGGRKTRTAGCKHQQSPASVTAGYQGASPLAGYHGASPLAGYQGVSPLASYQGASPLASYQGASPLASYQGASPLAGYQGASLLASYQGASPLAGYQGASPLASYQGASPLAGYQGASPLAGYQGASPLASYQGASPLASYQGASPLAGYQGASPLAGYQGTSPLASCQGASPLAGYQGTSPLASCQGASPLAGYQGASPLAGYQGVSPLAGYQGASPQAGYQGASPLAGYQGASPLAGYQGASPLAGYQGVSPLASYQGASPLAGYQGASPLADYQGASPLDKRSGHDEQDHTDLAGAMDETPERLELLTEELESAAGAQGKGKLQHKAKPQREERDARPKGKPQGEEVLREDHDDSSSTTTEASSNTDTEEPGNKNSRLPTMEKDKEEMREPCLKSKSRKPAGTKEKSQASSSLELPYITPLENKRKAFNSKTVINQSLASVSPAAAKASPSKPKVHAGNVTEQRPVPPPPSGSSSGSEGDYSISPPPEWDCVPLEHSGVDSLQQISMQTMSAEVFLKRDTRTPPSVSTRTPPSVSTWTPPPVSTRTPPPVSTRTPPPVSTWTPPPVSTRTPPSVSTWTPPPVSTRTPLPVSTRTPPPFSTRTPPSVSTGFSECSSCSTDETGLNAAGSKDKLTLSVSLPGQYGNPTFAAVAAGYDKSPGGSSAGRGSVGRMGVAHMASVDSDCSDSPGLLSPIGIGRAPGISNAFSAFGTSDLFNLSGVLGGAASGGNEHQQSWPDFSHIYSSTSSSGSRDPLEPWNTAGHPPTSMLGSSSLWSSSPPPFSPSIWSTSPDSSPLHSFPPPASHLPHLIGCSAPSSLPRPPPGILNPAYNPWSVWRPNFSGRGSEPWPRPPDNAK